MNSTHELVKQLDYEKYFNDEERLMIEIIGIDKFITLLEEFKSTYFYFSTERLNEIKKEWVKKQGRSQSKFVLCKKTGFSQRTIERLLGDPIDDEASLFD